MPEAALLHCPIRGQLRVRQRAADQLTFTEEKQRIDAIRYLIQRRYPREHFGVETTLFKLGNSGRNSFRTDFAVYDQPFLDLRERPAEERLEHLKLLAEIKRENVNAETAKATQVRAALQLVPDLSTLGVYWDDVEQRFFYREIVNRRQAIREAPLSKIPEWGSDVGSTRLTYADLVPGKNLIRIFDELEDALHTYVADKVERYEIILQLLLVKLHDEQTHRGRTTAMELQDFSVEASLDTAIARRLNEALARAATHYNQWLPKKIKSRFGCPTEPLRNATKILAPINILGSKTQVIQAFYMKFAKSLYKWDLAQYFTPPEVIDFIVDVVNPRYGEHAKDPACGSADFLVRAFRHAGGGEDSRNCVWGSDNSEQAVQVSILNMVLNGDGKSQIHKEDSLEAYRPGVQQNFPVVLCNPPFGTRIVERRAEVLRKFDLGHTWELVDGRMERTDNVQQTQQTGILFAELCVRLADSPRGRIGIILPNGYLGNRSGEYVALREWLLRHTKLVGIVSFPRFTFKKSGADVSASVVFLERRRRPLPRASNSENYRFFVGTIESVGWEIGDKKAEPIHLKDPETGTLLLDDENEPILDADFSAVLNDFLRSPAADSFPWILADREIPRGPQAWSVAISDVVGRNDLNLDPKRHSFKFYDIRRQVLESPHFRLGDLLVPVAPGQFRPVATQTYRYVEIGKVVIGEYDYDEMRGWQLPSRAKLRAQPGDIFIAHVWGSVEKWFMAAGDCGNLVITNGFMQTRFRDGILPEEHGADLIAGLCSEAYRVQARALATGSDGLAEVSDDDFMSIVLPRITNDELRVSLNSQFEALQAGNLKFSKNIGALVRDGQEYPAPPPRKSHCSLV